MKSKDQIETERLLLLEQLVRNLLSKVPQGGPDEYGTVKVNYIAVTNVNQVLLDLDVARHR